MARFLVLAFDRQMILSRVGTILAGTRGEAVHKLDEGGEWDDRRQDDPDNLYSVYVLTGREAARIPREMARAVSKSPRQRRK